jgi:hypothetical protein
MATQSRDPTRRQILAACKRIRAEWTEKIRLQRNGQTLGELHNRMGSIKVIPTTDLPQWAKDIIDNEDW